MKKLTAIAGSTVVGVLGLAGAHAQTVYGLAPNLTSQELSKSWSVQATLRGFYDDNYTTAPDSAKLDSFGFEITPSVSLNLPREQTYIGLSAAYTARWFEDRQNNEIDHIFQITGNLTHAFNPRHRVELRDSFVVAQEGELITPGTATTIARSEGDNIRNIANVNYSATLTETISVVLGYQNSFYDYDQEGIGSFSATLDRLEHLLSATGRMQISPPTTVLAGYQYGMSDFTSDDLIQSSPAVAANARDSRSHFFFGGVEHSFTPQLAASLRAGVQFIDFPNDPAGSDGSTPYIDGSVSWTYNPGSYLLAGIRHQRNVTDVAFANPGGSPTTDSEATVFYAAVNHQLTAKLTGSLIGQYQMSQFQNGAEDGNSEDFFTVGLNFAYRINQFLSAEAGYNFDLLDSEVTSAVRDFERNRLYMGLRAIY
jgi:hypothetical protein